MADTMTKEQRHRCMSHIRSRDTSPELLVRKALFAEGFRFRVNVRSLPGTPDIVLKKYNTVIFVNGCFWHGHRGCRLYSEPGSNSAYWHEKVERNRRRDVAAAFRLEARGWNVITVWECQLDRKHREETIGKLAGMIRRNGELFAKLSEDSRERRALSRNERAIKKTRTEELETEIGRIYPVPLSVKKKSESDDDDY